MTTANNPRPVWTLMTRCTLTATCLLLSGCSILCKPYIEELTTTEDSHHAAVVLLTRSANSANPSIHRIVKDDYAKVGESVELDFNWDKITIAGTPLRLFAEKQHARKFRLNVFEYESGIGIPSASMKDFEPVDDKDRKLTHIPLDTLLTVVFTFKLSDAPDEEYGTPASFVVLFKKTKDVQQAKNLQKKEP